MNLNLRNKMRARMNEVRAQVAERDDLIEVIAIALLTHKNVFILGDTGQAKSYAINLFRSGITGTRQFERLMSKQTDEEALFGRLDLSSLIPGGVPEQILERDPRYQEMQRKLDAQVMNRADTSATVAEMEQYRKALSALHSGEPCMITKGKIPDSHICFLDEIFKASDGILNALLTALNERRYTNEGKTIDIPTISTTMLENVAYLRFSSITNNTSQHLEAAIRQASQNGATALIFDIRGIESDNVTVIGNMLDILLGKMTTIYQEDASGISQELMSSDESEVELPMVVLADNTTAGTTELFAQALRDTGKARTVGETTFGKGTQQSFYKLKNGSAIYLTVARYAGPSGETYDQVGVPADYEVAYPAEMDKTATMGDPEYDSQLRRAMEIASAAVKTDSEG